MVHHLLKLQAYEKITFQKPQYHNHNFDSHRNEMKMASNFYIETDSKNLKSSPYNFYEPQNQDYGIVVSKMLTFKCTIKTVLK